MRSDGFLRGGDRRQLRRALRFLETVALEWARQRARIRWTSRRFWSASSTTCSSGLKWASTAVIVTWDDSDGWCDHVMGPVVNSSVGPADALSGEGLCGDDERFCRASPEIRTRWVGGYGLAAGPRHLAMGAAELRRPRRRTTTSIRVSSKTCSSTVADGGGSFDALAGPAGRHARLHRAAASRTHILLAPIPGLPREK